MVWPSKFLLMIIRNILVVMKRLHLNQKDVIIVEGIFALENKTLRDMMDVKFMLIQMQI